MPPPGLFPAPGFLGFNTVLVLSVLSISIFDVSIVVSIPGFLGSVTVTLVPATLVTFCGSPPNSNKSVKRIYLLALFNA